MSILPPPVKGVTPEMRARAIARAERQAAMAEPKRKCPRKLDRAPPEPTGGYARLTAAFYRDSRMSAPALRLVQQIVEWARGRGSCDAYVEQLAEVMAVSVRTVQRAQRRAEFCGYICVEHVRVGRTNDANVYHLLAAAIPPSRAPKPRTAARRRLRTVRVTDVSPHKEGSKDPSPLNPPIAGGRKMRRGLAVAAPSALKRGAGGETADVIEIRLPGGQRKHRAKTGPP